MPSSAPPAPGSAATWTSGGPNGVAPANGAKLVRPDGYGVWTENGISAPFLYEHDNGTERLTRLAGKLDGYGRLAIEAGHPNWVLFTFPGPRREADARRVLTHPTVPVATTSRPPGLAPDTAVWLPTTSTGPRLRLTQLADLPLDNPATSRQ